MMRSMSVGSLFHITAEYNVIVGTDGAEQISGRQYGEPKFSQGEVPNNLRMEQAHHVGECRRPETGRELFCNRRTANHMATLKYQCILTGLCEIRTAGQAVVAAADNYGVVMCGSHAL